MSGLGGWLALALGILTVACGSDSAPRHHDPTIPRRLRLLTDSQFTNAVKDLLGDVAVPAVETPGTEPHQFIDEGVIAVDAAQLVQYRIAAEEIGRQVAGQSDPLGCTGDVACVHAAVDNFASRAFRRTLDTSEDEQLAQLYSAGGFGLVVEAVLQSPSFLYRTELGAGRGEHVALTPVELAGAVSFLLLDSIPDKELWQRAIDGSLVTDAELRRQLDRLLYLPRVRAHLDDVVLRWLQIHRVLSAAKDPSQYPDFDPALLQSMFDESAAFVHDVLWNRHASLTELLTSRETFVDAKLASHYGLTGVHGDALVRVTMPRQRAGILTQASLLTALATTQRESIIQRGIYVNRTFLCTPELGRPPFGAIAEVSPLTGKLTESQFAYFRAGHNYCSGCHRIVDPPGRALEQFDGVARMRDVDTISQPIDADTIIEIDGVSRPIHGAVELAGALARSNDVARCAVEQLVRHAFGRTLPKPSLDSLVDQFEENDRDLVSVFRTLVMSSDFRERIGAP